MRRKVGKGERSAGDALRSPEGAGVLVAVVEIAMKMGSFPSHPRRETLLPPQ